MSGAWAVILAGGVVLALNMGIRQTFGLFMEPIHLDTGISWAAFSFAMAIQNLLWGLLTPFAGMVADRWGSGRVLAAGGVLYATGLAVMALWQVPAGVHLGGGILVGFAVGATGFPLVLGVVARAVPPESRSAALGLASAGGSLGQFLLLPLSQGLINGPGWSTALLVLAGLAALAVPLSTVLKGRPQEDVELEGRALSLMGALKDAAKDRSYRLLTAGFFVCGFHVAFIATHFPGYVSSCALSPMVGATALSIVGFFNIIGSFGAGELGGRLPKRRLLSGIYLARSAAITLFLLGPKTETTVWLFSACFGLLWLSTVPLTSGLVGVRFGTRYMASLFGIVMLGHQIGAFFGAWLGGIGLELTGSYDLVWGLAIGLGLLSAALHWPISETPIAEARSEAGRS